jgi:5S rRNA maturation endonuclease (ribonuclease M5)
VGIISVNAMKFMNWSTGKGGGGAIDLICHIRGDHFKQAVEWLIHNFEPAIALNSPAASAPEKQTRSSHRQSQSPRPFRPPTQAPRNIPRITHYLCVTRALPLEIVTRLIDAGTLYADNRGNAVFLLLGKEKKVVGAELRGTGSTKWRGMAPGSLKKLGCFYVLGESNRKMVLCESAIDAVSCHVLYPEYTAISTSGAHHDPAWLKKFIANGCDVFCGFDADPTGDTLARKMMALHPSVKRLRPDRHDWNEVLQGRIFS